MCEETSSAIQRGNCNVNLQTHFSCIWWQFLSRQNNRCKRVTWSMVGRVTIWKSAQTIINLIDAGLSWCLCCSVSSKAGVLNLIHSEISQTILPSLVNKHEDDKCFYHFFFAGSKPTRVMASYSLSMDIVEKNYYPWKRRGRQQARGHV